MYAFVIRALATGRPGFFFLIITFGRYERRYERMKVRTNEGTCLFASAGDNSTASAPPGPVDKHLSFDTVLFISTSNRIADTYAQVMSANPTAWSSLPVVGAMLATDVRNKPFKTVFVYFS